MTLPHYTPISWNRLHAFFLRHLFPLKRDFDLLSDMLYWPVIDILVWGITSTWLSAVPGPNVLVVSILSGLILWQVIWRSQSEVSRNLMDEIWNNNLVNLFSTPLTLLEWIVGVLLLSLLKMCFTVSILVVLIFFLYSVNIFTIGWWLVPFLVETIIMGWWIGFLAAGIVIRWGPKVQTVIWTLPGILLPFSVVYFPLALLPTFLRPISYSLPTTYVFESMRAVLAGQAIDWPWLSFSFGLNLIYLFLSICWFRASFRASLKLGLGRFN